MQNPNIEPNGLISTQPAIEQITWVDASKEVPDAKSEVLVCYQRNDCDETDVTLAVYDNYDDDRSPWWVQGGLCCFGKVLLWAHKPIGSQR